MRAVELNKVNVISTVNRIYRSMNIKQQ